MSDDIFIKHGLGSFQQPYNARQPSNAQQPNIRAQQEPNIRNIQEPNIRAQQEPNIRQARQPLTYNHRSPLTYNHRSPFTYQHRSPSITQATYNHRQPLTYNHQSPSTYRHPIIYQHPSIYIHRVPYIANGQEPNIRDRQNAYPYIANAQEPNIRPHQQPNIKSAQEPNIVNAQEPNIRQARQPFTYNHRSPSTYARQGQTPSTYNHRSPSTYARQGQTPTTYQHRSPSTYARQGQTPTTYDHRSPYTIQARTPANGRVPYIYDGDTTSVSALRSDWHTDGFGGPIPSNAEVDLFVKYVGDKIQIWGKYSGYDEQVGGGGANSPSLTYTLCYEVEPDYENAANDYTVRYTIASQGDANILGSITTTASAIPTTNSKSIQFAVDCDQGGAFGGFNSVIVNTSISIILEKSGFTTWTWSPSLYLRCISSDIQ